MQINVPVLNELKQNKIPVLQWNMDKDSKQILPANETKFMLSELLGSLKLKLLPGASTRETIEETEEMLIGIVVRSVTCYE
jgi:hypothetical protein